jgi:hypothetical protein
MGPLQGVPLGTNPIGGAMTIPIPESMIQADMAKHGRTLDPIKAAALHEAVRHLGYHDYAQGEEGQQQVIACAERFEVWLAGPETT